MKYKYNTNKQHKRLVSAEINQRLDYADTLMQHKPKMPPETAVICPLTTPQLFIPTADLVTVLIRWVINSGGGRDS